MKEVNIKVVEGGESLYIYPVAYYSYDSSKMEQNKILYFEAPEFGLYDTELVARWDYKDYRNFLYKKGRFQFYWNMTVGRFLNAVWQASTPISKVAELSWWKDFHWIFSYTLASNTPFIGVSIFRNYISTNNQLLVWDEDRLVEGPVYLVPSQKYLEQKFLEWEEEAKQGLQFIGEEEPDYDDDEDTPEVVNGINDWWNTKGRLIYKAEIYKEYLEWKASLDPDLTIGFVCSLNT